mgnify:CR=1 FL=1
MSVQISIILLLPQDIHTKKKLGIRSIYGSREFVYVIDSFRVQNEINQYLHECFKKNQNCVSH